MTGDERRERFAAARVARLATVDAPRPAAHRPVTFALQADTVYSVTDAKPKRTTALRRYDNVRANPAVALLVDRYEDDWSKLWWVRADGSARILDADTARPSTRSNCSCAATPSSARPARCSRLMSAMERLDRHTVGVAGSR